MHPKDVWAPRKDKRCTVRGDHGVTLRGDFSHDLDDKPLKMIGRSLIEHDGRDAGECGCLPREPAAKLGQNFAQKRLPAFGVLDVSRGYASLFRSARDDLIVHVAESEFLGHESSDLFASGTCHARDTDHTALHPQRRYAALPHFARRGGSELRTWPWLHREHAPERIHRGDARRRARAAPQLEIVGTSATRGDRYVGSGLNDLRPDSA